MVLICQIQRSKLQQTLLQQPDAYFQQQACLAHACHPSASLQKQSSLTEWLLKLEPEKFWSWLEDTDNATHFKSKEMLYYYTLCLRLV
jgi:hypothetical protein